MLREVSHSNVNSRHLETRLTWGYTVVGSILGGCCKQCEGLIQPVPNEWHVHRHKEGGTGEVA